MYRLEKSQFSPSQFKLISLIGYNHSETMGDIPTTKLITQGGH